MNNFNNNIWIYACSAEDVPENGGVCLKFGDKQIALFNFTACKQWFAVQNLCPHKNQMVLSRGILGDKDGEPKVACPFHKKTFSLISGSNLDGEDYKIETYPIKVVDGKIFVKINKNDNS